jgi:hypothetical protein
MGPPHHRSQGTVEPLLKLSTKYDMTVVRERCDAFLASQAFTTRGSPDAEKSHVLRW